MNFRNLWIGLALTAGSLPAAGSIQPGEAVPDVVLQDRLGTKVRLSTYRQQKHVALLVHAPGAALAPAVAEDTCRRLAALDSAVLFLSRDEEAARWLVGDAPSATLLIDSEGVARRVLRGRLLSGPDLAGFVKLWLTGKTVFKTACARCHGEDGDSTICWDVKALVGIGKRMSEAEIRDRLRLAVISDNQVVIRSQFFTRREADAVIAYVAGL